jgi:cation diffusion facilitator family transporter
MLIVGLTAIMMVVEIWSGLIYGSMALLADGLHMASHTTALGIAVFAYILSRRLAANTSFAFGVGKINSLAGFGSAVLLLGFAVIMATESLDRLANPTAIAFDQALIVAVVGLVVNAVSAWVLISTPHDHHGHDHGHDDHDDHHGHDHNLRAAYLHVLADALTSFLAIFALLAGKYMGAAWLDPAMGIVGSILVARWSYGLIKDSAVVLLDKQADQAVQDKLRTAIEVDTQDRITDLHVWSIGHGILAAEITVISDEPKPSIEYKQRIPDSLNIVHATIEVNLCPNH